MAVGTGIRWKWFSPERGVKEDILLRASGNRRGASRNPKIVPAGARTVPPAAYPGMPIMIHGLKKLVPRSVKEAAKDLWRAQRLNRAIRELAILGPRDRPVRSTIELLRAGWGNEDYSAKVVYIEEILRQLDSTSGPILECGSGLTTLLLGVLAERRSREVWTLEHDPLWHARVEAALRKQRILGARLCLAPLVDYGGFTWYAPLEELPRRFGLVICDGPPEATPGGRYGLLPASGDRLSAGTVVLLDDASRESESQILARWWAEAGWKFEIRDEPPTEYAVIRCV
jgi:hypothetical protein